MKCLVAACLIVYVVGMLAACGQKGPLVLPDAPKRKHTLPSLPNAAKPDTTTGTSSPAGSSPAAPATPAFPPPPATTPQPDR